MKQLNSAPRFGLDQRSLVPELMDDPNLDETAHLQALKGLRRINVVSLTALQFRAAIENLLNNSGLHRARILELACGGGDVLLALEAQLKKNGRWDITLEGCDLSPRSVRFAEQSANLRKSRSRFLSMNVSDDPLPEGYDVFISSLFLHHLTDEAIIELFRKMSKVVNIGFVVSDLERSRLGLAVTSAAVRILSRSPVVHSDGVQSLRASFTPQELAELASQAGLKDFTLKRCWPFRLLLVWRKVQ